jgi:hypothetical protein
VIHELKTWPGPFAAVLAGTKTYEIRVADRDYKVGDVLHLREFVPGRATLIHEPACPPHYTGRSIDVEVTYLTPGGEWGLPYGLCVMSIRKVDEGSLCGELLESLRLASTTSDGYRDAHAAYQRWAARLAPDAIGDEAKRAAIEWLTEDRPIQVAVDSAGNIGVTYIARPGRPLLTEEQRTALRHLRVDAEDDLMQLEQLAKTRDVSHTLALASAQVAALRAVLGEEQP